MFSSLTRFLSSTQKGFGVRGFLAVKIRVDWKKDQKDGNSARNNINMHFDREEIPWSFCKMEFSDHSLIYAFIANDGESADFLRKVLKSDRPWTSAEIQAEVPVTDDLELLTLAREMTLAGVDRRCIGYGTAKLPAIGVTLIQESEAA